MSPASRRVFIISGVVQGVGYRQFALGAARRLEVVGFARNLEDGRVQVFAAGPEEALIAFRQELERGPLESRVDEVTESEGPGTEVFTAFTIRG